MRISASIVSSGDCWSASFPRIDFDKAFPKNESGNPQADPIECLRQLNSSMITHSSSDTHFLRSVVCNWIHNINGWKDENCINEKTADGVEQTIKRLERRSERDQVTHVRADWTTIGGEGDRLRCRIRVHSRDDVVQKTEYERLFAWIMAEAVEIVSENLVNGGMKPIDMTDETRALLDELKAWRAERKEAEERDKTNKNRCFCERFNHGFCTPCKFDCPHCKNGKCEEI